MSDLLKTLLLLAIGIIGGMLFFKFGCASDEDVKRVVEENQRIRKQLDSLEAINRISEARLDSLRQASRVNQAKIDSLHRVVERRQEKITKYVRDLNVYKGTPTDLLRELNEFVDSPLPPLPDTSFAR